jgi:hypothetical protein
VSGVSTVSIKKIVEKLKDLRSKDA